MKFVVQRLTNKRFHEDFFQIKIAMTVLVQQKPLNMITLGQSKSDDINRMTTITDYFYSVVFDK